LNFRHFEQEVRVVKGKIREVQEFGLYTKLLVPGEKRETNGLLIKIGRMRFLRLVETKEFKNWLKVETSRALGNEIEVEEYVKRAMSPKNIRTEIKENGRWTEVDGKSLQQTSSSESD